MTRVAASPLRPVIYLDGRDKREATDEVLLAVADYALAHFGGHLRAKYIGTDGEPDLTIEVRVTETPPIGGHTPVNVHAHPPEAPRPSDRRTASPEGTPAPDPAQQIHDHENGGESDE